MIPPITTVASGRCTSAPRPVASAMPLSRRLLMNVIITSPCNTATPESAMKPIPAEIDNGIPRSSRAIVAGHSTGEYSHLAMSHVVKVPSPLEQLVLETLWRGGELSVREVLDALGTDHAYTTILTLLQRLHDKRIVRRRRVEGAWSYRAAEPRESWIARRLHALLAEAGPERDAVLVAFVDTAEEADPAVLNRLEGMLRRRRLDRGDR